MPYVISVNWRLNLMKLSSVQVFYLDLLYPLNTKYRKQLLILLLKLAAQAQVEIKCFESLSQPHKHLRHWKLKKILREATNGWLLPLTHPTFWCQTPCREGYYTYEPAGNTLQIGTFYQRHAIFFTGAEEL